MPMTTSALGQVQEKVLYSVVPDAMQDLMHSIVTNHTLACCPWGPKRGGSGRTPIDDMATRVDCEGWLPSRPIICSHDTI